MRRILQSNWERIADAGINVAGDAAYRAPIEGLARALGEALERATALDLEPLRKAGATEAQAAAILRAMESEYLCALRECDSFPDMLPARNQPEEVDLRSDDPGVAAYLEGIVANAPIGIVATNSDFVVTDANSAAAALYGASSPHALIGQVLPDLCASGGSEFRAALTEVYEGRGPSCGRYSFSTRFGGVVNCEARMAPLRAAPDTARRVVTLMQDISGQVALEQNLVQSEKLQALGEIIAGVAHELNNPLTGIMGYAQLLMAAQLDAGLKSKLEHISEEATRCRQIVQNLLSFSRRHDPEKSLQQVNDLLEQTVALREYQIRVDGIDLSWDLAPDLPPIMVDPHELQRVFLNIITNAQQALAGHGDRKRAIRIATSLKDGHVHIRFSDNGPGIPKDKLSRVFDPFFTTKGVGDGTGLGLSVSYGIVFAHGGRIDLNSTEGEGATFTVILPVSTPKR